ncbi:MAG: hypothetical protein V2I33_02305 [Kangiellaceae bacterium]|jgi:hypothetical protein|nr:hypothetical protein [Kangiellaceae bacterium]
MNDFSESKLVSPDSSSSPTLGLQDWVDNKFVIAHNDDVSFISVFDELSVGLTKSIIKLLSKKFPYQSTLWDLSQSIFDFKMPEIQLIANYCHEHLVQAHSFAMYVNNDLAFGEMNQLSAFRDINDSVQTKVFTCKNQALHWLKHSADRT